MLEGNIGVSEDDVGELPHIKERTDFALAIAEATGTLVSRQHPLGTHCFPLFVSASTIPRPDGSRWTTHQPPARVKTINESPLT